MKNSLNLRLTKKVNGEEVTVPFKKVSLNSNGTILAEVEIDNITGFTLITTYRESNAQQIKYFSQKNKS